LPEPVTYYVTPAIGSEENSVVFYLETETDSYYFITEEYTNKYASAIRHNIMCCVEWQKHNYYYNNY